MNQPSRELPFPNPMSGLLVLLVGILLVPLAIVLIGVGAGLADRVDTRAAGVVLIVAGVALLVWAY